MTVTTPPSGWGNEMLEEARVTRRIGDEAVDLAHPLGGEIAFDTDASMPSAGAPRLRLEPQQAIVLVSG